MAGKAGRRQFGSIRKLPSGRWQARYAGPDGQVVRAPSTFTTKGDAGRWLDGIRTDMDRGRWIDPTAGRVPLDTFAHAWLRDRPLRPVITKGEVKADSLAALIADVISEAHATS